MAAPDWNALTAAVLARRQDVADVNCPAVPLPRSGTAGHLGEKRSLLRVSGVPLGIETNAEAGRSGGRGTGSVPPRPACVPEGGTARDRDAARLLQLAEAGVAALAEPDPDLDAEREAIVAARAAEATGDVPALLPEADHRDHLARLRRSGLQRPPSWADASALPSPGAWCGCCSRHRPKAGGRWWRAVAPRSDGLGIGPGWCCLICHPPPPGAAVEVVDTRPT